MDELISACPLPHCSSAPFHCCASHSFGKTHTFLNINEKVSIFNHLCSSTLSRMYQKHQPPTPPHLPIGSMLMIMPMLMHWLAQTTDAACSFTHVHLLTSLPPPFLPPFFLSLLLILFILFSYPLPRPFLAKYYILCSFIHSFRISGTFLFLSSSFSLLLLIPHWSPYLTTNSSHSTCFALLCRQLPPPFFRHCSDELFINLFSLCPYNLLEWW
ncbi:MAG: hypothetical protein J3R72DRAFT_449564 [Linnemannia gamsii]|nr:MAG: hypothetical protein J3R72DRAFT_449564 [Linnemannia gamsii]